MTTLPATSTPTTAATQSGGSSTTTRVVRGGALLDKCAVVVAKHFQEDTKQYLSEELLTRVQKHMTKEAQIRYLGVYKRWFSNNLLFKFHAYNSKTGKKNGRCFKFWENGKLKFMTDYLSGIRHGEHKVWNKDGVLLLHEWYKDGERDGICVRWWEETGKILGRYSFRSGALDGESTEFYRNGDKWTLNNFKQGARHGELKCWYPGGELIVDDLYVEGKLYQRRITEKARVAAASSTMTVSNYNSSSGGGNIFVPQQPALMMSNPASSHHDEHVEVVDADSFRFDN